MRAQVGIVGAGPAGLLLARLLHLQGIDCVVLESRSRTYVENRLRAGLMEQATVDLLKQSGLGERLGREGVPHDGLEFVFEGQRRRIDLASLVDRRVTIYGQQEIVRDMIAVNLEAGVSILFEAQVQGFEGLDGDTPTVRYREQGVEKALACDLVAGCDGFHGAAREAFPVGARRDYDRVYPFGWLGVLVDAPPTNDELIYCRHARGFALFTMRSPSVSRLYLQVAPDEDVAEWSDDRIWSELGLRLGRHDGLAVSEGPITQKSVTAMRSFVSEPMRVGRLFIAGDAAHIVPPTGAKGMNLAIADIHVLARAMERFFKRGDASGLDAYSDVCLRRVWRAQHFSWWMTSMLHPAPDASPFDLRRQVAELETVTGSEAGRKLLAENYAGTPFDA